MSATIITAQDCLATVPGYQLGARSENDFVQAVQLVRSHRAFAFQSHGNAVTNLELDTATNDFAQMLAWQKLYADLNLGWRVRSYRPGDKFRSMFFENPREKSWALKDFGISELPLSWEITREGNRSGQPTYWLFCAENAEPSWDFNAKLRDCHLCKSFPLPGSIHRGTKQRWEWAKCSAPGEAVLQWIPEKAKYGLPMIGGGISARVVSRPEYTPPTSPRYSGKERQWSHVPPEQRQDSYKANNNQNMEFEP